MRRYFIVIGLILILLVINKDALAQRRGLLSNVYASWVSVTTTQTTVTLPANSRDLWIQNGSSTDICVSPNGKTISEPGAASGMCLSAVDSFVFQMDGPSYVHLRDFPTGSVTMMALSGTASPVSVISTF